MTPYCCLANLALTSDGVVSCQVPAAGKSLQALTMCIAPPAPPAPAAPVLPSTPIELPPAPAVVGLDVPAAPLSGEPPVDRAPPFDIIPPPPALGNIPPPPVVSAGS